MTWRAYSATREGAPGLTAVLLGHRAIAVRKRVRAGGARAVGGVVHGLHPTTWHAGLECAGLRGGSGGGGGGHGGRRGLALAAPHRVRWVVSGRGALGVAQVWRRHNNCVRESFGGECRSWLLCRVCCRGFTVGESTSERA